MGEGERLGMPTVTDNHSSLYGQCPAPRPVQNGFDRECEQYAAHYEVLVLKELQNAMRRTTQKSWTVIFTSILIVLLIRERDIWRLLYWVYYPEQVSPSIL
jgi:hypothetical protein